MRGLFGRRSNLTEADKARLGEVEEVLNEFREAVDEAITIVRADGSHDVTLSRLSAYGVDCSAQIRKDVKAAKKAFEDGEREQADEFMRRADTRARQGIDDLEGLVAEFLDEEVRPPPGSPEAASWVPLDDPRLRRLRDIPVGFVSQ